MNVNKFLKYLAEVIIANAAIIITIAVSLKKSKINQPINCPIVPPAHIIMTNLYTGYFLQTYITQISVKTIKGRKTAKTNLAGNINNIIGTPKPPKLPPNPDLETETTKTEKKAIK